MFKFNIEIFKVYYTQNNMIPIILPILSMADQLSYIHMYICEEIEVLGTRM